MKLVNPYRTILVNFEPSTARLYIKSLVAEDKADNGILNIIGIHTLQHHLAKHDAKDCMDDKQCVSMGLEISQHIKNIQEKQFYFFSPAPGRTSRS